MGPETGAKTKKSVEKQWTQLAVLNRLADVLDRGNTELLDFVKGVLKTNGEWNGCYSRLQC